MWNENRSLILSKICVIGFSVLLLLSLFFAPTLFREWIINYPEARLLMFRMTVYLGCVPAALLLILLYLLLHRIGNGLVFIRQNVKCLRQISWCCFAGAIIAASSSFYWFPWFAVGIAAGFMGLIVRVVKNVFERAVTLQEDADFTI